MATDYITVVAVS